MRDQLGKPVPSPVVLAQISEKFRESVKTLAEQEDIPLCQFRHKERKDDIANGFRRRREVRDAIVFIGVAQEKPSRARRSTGSSSSIATRRSTSIPITSRSMRKSSARCFSRSAVTRRGV